MKFSHSKLKLFLNCPMTYHLKYDLGITPKVKSQALSSGEAIHWGLEHNTSDLTQFYKENPSLKNFKNNDNQILEEVIIEAFLKNKEKIFNKILTTETGEKLELLEEIHEYEINSKISSKVVKYNEFKGIIDLLLVTNKGFIIVDYKTSSSKPDFNEYLSQLYKYIYLCNYEFPDYPVYRIAIINLQKSKTKRKPIQTEEQYKKQLEKEYIYVEDDDDLIRINIFDRDIISDEVIKKSVEDLANLCDYAYITTEACNKNNIFYINWDHAKEYGGSPYLDLLENRYGCQELYVVKDKYLFNKKIYDTRPMKEIDVKNIYEGVPIEFCRYKNFEPIYVSLIEKGFKNNEICNALKEIYNINKIDEDLINSYIKIYEAENKSK